MALVNPLLTGLASREGKAKKQRGAGHGEEKDSYVASHWEGPGTPPSQREGSSSL